MSRTYPRQVWVLMPSFKPVEITVIEKYKSWGGEYDGDVTAVGKIYHISAIFESKEDAIKDGRERCVKMRADIAEREEKLRKKITALDKAEAK